MHLRAQTTVLFMSLALGAAAWPSHAAHESGHIDHIAAASTLEADAGRLIEQARAQRAHAESFDSGTYMSNFNPRDRFLDVARHLELAAANLLDMAKAHRALVDANAAGE